MPWFEGTHTETRTLSVEAATLRAHLQDPQTMIQASKGVETATVDDGVVHFQLEEEDHQVVKFKGDYKVRYENVDGGVRWTTLPGGNLDQAGEATVRDLGDGTSELVYTETVKIDLGVPGMMAPMLKPMIGPMLAGEVKSFVQRLVDNAPN